MTTEKILFNIALYAKYWDKPPIVEIFLDNVSKHTQEITGTENNPTVITFEETLNESVDYKFIIKNLNKDNSQTIIENGQIVKDQILFIKSITIDEIDLGSLIYEAKFYPEYPEPWASEQRAAGKELPEFMKNVISIGHNGRWELQFSSPFYMWLLENLY